jgi:hypothetical protein
MAWTAEVTGKDYVGGTLEVIVLYADGKRSFKDKLVSRSDQAVDWLESAIERRLTDLEGLDKLAVGITSGPVVPGTKPPHPNPTARDVYAAKLREFEGWLSALRQGVTTVDRPAFVTLKLWLVANWEDSYIELYLQ